MVVLVWIDGYWLLVLKMNSYATLVEIWGSDQFCLTSLYLFRTGTTYIQVGLNGGQEYHSLLPLPPFFFEKVVRLWTTSPPAATTSTSGAREAIPLVQHTALASNRMDTTTVVASGSANLLVWVGDKNVIMGEDVLLPIYSWRESVGRFQPTY